MDATGTGGEGMAEEQHRAAAAGDVFRLDGRRAIVTGAASGLGKAIALGFARYGADVACLDIDVEGARATQEEISGLGRESVAVEVDVRDWGSVQASVEEVK